MSDPLQDVNDGEFSSSPQAAGLTACLICKLRFDIMEEVSQQAASGLHPMNSCKCSALRHA